MGWHVQTSNTAGAVRWPGAALRRRAAGAFAFLGCLGWTAVNLLTASAASEPAPGPAGFFTQKVEPILRDNCYKCHSHASEKIKGGLVVDSLAGLLKGGDTAAAVVPGDLEKSLLIKAVLYTDKDLRMPPKDKKLSDEQIATLQQWVKLGAPWPGADLKIAKKASRPHGKITEEDRQWWAFRPVRDPGVPAVKEDHWSRNEIDRFIYQRLQTEGLTPAPEAARAALVRRVYFDVIGLPPSPAEVEAFVNDNSANAYEKLIDRLLASPRYGERWARHWLDLVRYADSDGYRIDDYRPNSWRYRDYVIKSFNEDKPYDRFVQEQLAGDELFPDNPDALIATGYLRHWIYEYNNRDVRGQWTTILNDLTDTTGDVFLGVGVQCAHCHDHKFDPILQKDYYRLQAFFAPIMPRDDLVAATKAQQAEYAVKLAKWEAETAPIRNEIAGLEAKYREAAAQDAVIKFPEEIQDMINKPVPQRSPLEHQLAELAYRQVYYEYDRLDRKLKGEDKEKVLLLRKKMMDFDKDKPAALPIAPVVTDVGPVAPPVTIPKKKGDPIEPGFLSVLDERPATIKPVPTAPNSTGRRAELARWLTQPENPLTARVLVNRLWQYHFGHGLAANASDFGKLGEQPSHPELLDWLATRLVKDGWSLKKMHRLILTSATYRESVTHPAPEPGKLKDPENRLLWRGHVRRLEAEQIRDAIFAVTGELNLSAGGPGVNNSEPRRTIYTRIMRNNRDPLTDVFDTPLWFASASSRDTTTTPVQSLLLINSQLMLKRAQALAARIEKESSLDEEQRIADAYRLTVGRAPAVAETKAALQFIQQQQERIDPIKAGSAKAAFLYDKLPFRDGQAAIMSPEGPQNHFVVPYNAALPVTNFTIEAFVLLRSIYDNASVRTVASHWSGSEKQPGWGFGVTGKKSRRKPQTLVLQLTGKLANGALVNEALFSDQHIQFNKPYYLAASVKLAGAEPGTVTFFVKDLSNDDEPLLIAKVPTHITGGYANQTPFIIGNRGTAAHAYFDGLIDDVRLSNTALNVDQLLFTTEGVNKFTVGYWQFEAKPDVFRDTAGHGLDIQPTLVTSQVKVDVRQAAFIDFCHVLLNSNEFLYVE